MVLATSQDVFDRTEVNSNFSRGFIDAKTLEIREDFEEIASLI